MCRRPFHTSHKRTKLLTSLTGSRTNQIRRINSSRLKLRRRLTIKCSTWSSSRQLSRLSRAESPRRPVQTRCRPVSNEARPRVVRSAETFKKARQLLYRMPIKAFQKRHCQKRRQRSTVVLNSCQREIHQVQGGKTSQVLKPRAVLKHQANSHQSC